MRRSLAVILIVASSASCAGEARIDRKPDLQPTTIDLTVTRDGSPVADARVLLDWWEHDPAANSDRRRRDEARTNALGRVTWTCDRPRSGIILRVDKADLGSEWRSVDPGGRTEVHVDMGSEALCRGTVRDERGRAVSDATTSLRSAYGDLDTTRTRADGSFVFHGLSARGDYSYVVTVDAPTPAYEPARVELVPPYERLDIVLHFGATIEVGAHHSTHAVVVKEAEWLLERREGEHWFPVTSSRVDLDSSRETAVFTKLDLGEYRIVARAGELGSGATDPIRIDGRNEVRRTMELGPEPPLRGRVVDRRGVPLSGVCVNLGTEPRPATGVVTDESGGYSIELPDMDACVVFSRGDSEPVVVPVLRGERNLADVVMIPSGQ